ncbi:hypothetical protein OPL79_002119 [Enterococcus faecalis]|jgi:hypothetical protein|uniref:hypothetical protein n=1 Tax=Enterococcus faecalis TaxID=1351 RepID=UPI00298407A2|nr:hypothetical protein [Enterococcus faecalis]EKB7628481.1 hypothetical protein [Enterococcus faecalis]
MADLEKRNRPSGLIKNTKITPTQSAETTKSSIPTIKKEKKKVTRNQDSNIKVSRQTKDQIDVLLKLTDNKFAYELIDTMIDNYVDTALDADKKRAFKTLTNL